MTTSDEQARARAEEEAAVWLVTLAEAQSDAAQYAGFAAWLDASPLHAEVWRRTARAYDFIGKGTPVFADRWAAAPKGPQGLAPRRTAGRPSVGTGRRIRLAAAGLAAAAAAILAIVLIPGMHWLQPGDHVTATAETRVLRLEDGSRVYLAPESVADVLFTAAVRRLSLIEGQAFFEVARDPDRAFEVQAGDTRVTVLGTAFDVERTARSTIVGVRSGFVRVDDVSTAIPTHAELQAGDWIEIAGRHASSGRRRAGDIGTWTGGRLVARDRPAGEVVDALRRYFDGLIVVEDPAFAARRVSGLYDLADPAGTLADLAASHDAAVWRVTPWLMVVTAR